MPKVISGGINRPLIVFEVREVGPIGLLITDQRVGEGVTAGPRPLGFRKLSEKSRLFLHTQHELGAISEPMGQRGCASLWGSDNGQ